MRIVLDDALDEKKVIVKDYGGILSIRMPKEKSNEDIVRIIKLVAQQLIKNHLLKTSKKHLSDT